MENKHNGSKPVGCNKSRSQREIYSDTGLPQINNLILQLKELEKEDQTKLKVSRRRGIVKIRAEMVTKRTIEKN